MKVLRIMLIALLVVLTVLPIMILIQKSFFTTQLDGSLGVFTIKYYQQIFNDDTFISSLMNTTVFALGSVMLALILGTVQAWIVERTNTPLKGLCYFGAIVSLGIPYILYTVSWLLILGKAGPVNKWLMALLETKQPVIDVYSLGGMILIEGFLWSPMVFLMLSASFRNVDASLEEAARMSGARYLSTLYNISFKLVFPSILAMAILVFIRAFEGFEIPTLVGLPGEKFVLTTRIYLNIHAKQPPEYGEASAFSIALMFLVVLLLAFYNRITRFAGKYQTITGKGYRPKIMDLGKWRHLTSALVVLNFIFMLVIPLAMVIWAALLPYYQSPNMKALSLLTLKNFANALKYPEYSSAAWNTVFVAIATSTVVMAVTALISWLSSRRKKGGWILDQLSTLPIIFPGVVLAVAVMEIYLAFPIGIYGTLWILFLGLVTKYLPYGMRYNYSGMLQIHNELEEAAQISGATPLNTFRVIIFPLLSPAFWAGWLFVLLMAARELALPALLSSPQTKVIAVSLFDLWNNGQVTEFSAFGMIWSLIMIIIAMIFYILSRRFGINVH